MILDFHTHTFPDKIAAPALKKMQGDSHSRAFSDGTRNGLLQAMQAAEIDRAVVLPVITNPAKTEHINDLSLALNGKDGLIYFGGIHPDTENTEKELVKLRDAGIKGVKIHPVYQNADIDDARYLRILAQCAELGLIVLTHAGDDIGFPGVVRCSPKMVKNALRQVKGVKLVLAHMGGWKNWESVYAELADEDVYIDTAFSLGEIAALQPDYYTKEQLRLLDAEAFCRLVRAFGAERVLFGTDSPWSDMVQSIRDIKALPLTDAEKAAILGKNAQKLLKI